MFVSMDDVVDSLRRKKFSHILPGDIQISADKINEWVSLKNSWNYLSIDRYMKNNDSYRRRAFSKFHVNLSTEDITPLADTRFFQGMDINNYAGGIERDLPAMSDKVSNNKILHNLIKNSLRAFVKYKENKSTLWNVYVHQFRIESEGSVSGNPTPEGMHKDGHTFISMHMINRSNISGGISSIYNTKKEKVAELTLKKSLESILLDDMDMYHSASKISSIDGGVGYRDLMVIDYNEKIN